MFAECYPIIAELFEGDVEKCDPSNGMWHTLGYLGGRIYLMVKYVSGVVKLAPLFIHTFPLLAPHHLLESEKFNIRFPSPAKITEIADRLRYHRYRKALLQREVADYIGVDRSTYIHYEEYGRDYYPLENMQKLADLFGVSVTDLLDDFNMFLYNDQGKQIRERRLALHMTQTQYARVLEVPLGTLKRWEQNSVRIFKSTWEKYFK